MVQMKHYAFVLEMVLRMRQACDHLSLVPERYHDFGFQEFSEDSLATMRRLIDLYEDGDATDCPICQVPLCLPISPSHTPHMNVVRTRLRSPPLLAVRMSFVANA